MAYYISPQQSQISHTVALQANFAGLSAIPAGHTIQWRKNGVQIKQGLTDDPFYLTINSALDRADLNNGVVFSPADTGSSIDFLIDPSGPTFGSNSVVLTNIRPVLSAAGPITDSYGVSPVRPTISWTFSDADADAQFSYRVRLGSTAGGTDYADSGIVLSSATSFAFPALSTSIPHGSTYYWTVDVTDGEQVNPFDPSPTPVRVLQTSSGTGLTNSKPVASNVLIDGVNGSAISNLTPNITWSYSDPNGQPQNHATIVVATDVGLTQVLWNSGPVIGTATNAVYNFNLSGVPLVSHRVVYVSVVVNDGIEDSTSAVATFSVSNAPVITTVTVDSKVNPLNVKDATPIFNWPYTDLDNDPLVGYEIRVSENDAFLGTDSFLGEIWNPGVVTTPQAYSTQFNFDGTAFPGCPPNQSLQMGIRYFFQVQVYDPFQKSAWATGYFQLNSPPTAANLQIIPAAPFNSDDLFPVYDFIDDIGDVEAVNSTQIRWFRQPVGGVFAEVLSIRNQRQVPASLTLPGDLWKFTVRPSDGLEYSVLTYESSPVTILDRAPTASALALLPSNPRTSDPLVAVFALSDPDQDPVTATINWFKNDIEQSALRNTTTIPASVTSVGERWHFTILPFDGFLNGPLAVSPEVTITNTAPQITSVSVDGMLLPRAVSNPNPTIHWTYQDVDLQPQQKYQVIIGTRPARTKKIVSGLSRALPLNSAGTGLSLACGGNDGIVSTTDGNGILVAGNEIFDSGVVESDADFFQYITKDFIKSVNVNAINFTNIVGMNISVDLQTLSLQPALTNGTATVSFSGETSFYDVALKYIRDVKRSTYRLIVDGVVAGQFTSQPGNGTDIYVFSAVRVQKASIIGIVAIPSDTDAKGQFQQLSFSPVTQLDLQAGSFQTLSGYLSDGTGGVKLAGLAGTATTKFDFPSGTYDIEFVYVTETNGNPIATLSLNNSVILSFTYESGAKTRSRFLTGVSVNRGDSLKISGTRNGGAMARVKNIILRPTSASNVGAMLRAGTRYYGSVRAFDGQDWSDWASTEFMMAGAAWAQASNAIGWTIEARFKVMPVTQPSIVDSVNKALTGVSSSGASGALGS